MPCIHLSVNYYINIRDDTPQLSTLIDKEVLDGNFLFFVLPLRQNCVTGL